jgi:ribosomal protein L19
MNNIQIRAFVRQLINEAKEEKMKSAKKAKKMPKTSVGDRLRMIDEAGDKAALEAKIKKIEEDIQEAHEIKNAIPSNIGHFVDLEIIGDLHDDLADSIKELEAKKAELEEQMKGMEAPAKGDKKKVDEKLKPSMGAGAYVKDFKKSKAPQFQGKSNEKKKDMGVAAYLSAKNK